MTKRGQVPRTPIVMPFRLDPSGRTTILRKAVRTNAGQRVRVSVIARTANGTRVTNPKRVKVVRSRSGKVSVRLHHARKLRVRVTLSAPSTDRFGRYRYRVTYPHTKPEVGFILPVFKWIFGKLWDGVTGKAVSALVGWATAGIFGTDDPTAELVAKLDEISRQLGTLQSSIDELKTSMDFGFCKSDSLIAGLGLAKVDTAQQRLQTILRSKDATHDDLLEWANTYVLGGDNVEYALNQIDKALNLGVEQAGSIGSCAKAMRNDWKTPLGEQAYYERLYNYLNFFTQYQVMGLNLVVEARHVRALDAAMKEGTPIPDKPEDYPKICAPKARKGLKSLRTECLGAEDMLTIVHNNIARQAVAAGAGYAWNTHPDGVQMAAQKDTGLVWVTDLNSYGNSPDCPKPLSSQKGACGPTAGTDNPIEDRSRAGYVNWRPGTAAEWEALLSLTPTRRVPFADLMAQAGMEPDQQGLIVYTGETSTSTDPGLQWLGGRAQTERQALAANPSALWFFDTNSTYDAQQVRVFRRGGQPFYSLADADWPRPQAGWYGATTSPLTATWSSKQFYDAEFEGRVYPAPMWGELYMPMSIVTKPGWMLTADSPATPGYRWPVMEAPMASNLGSSCRPLTLVTPGGDEQQVTLSGRNDGGAVSMCGKDFSVWLKSWLPDGEQ